MAQLLGDVKEAWMRASYADYPGTGTFEVKNKLATRTRLFTTELGQLRNKIDKFAAQSEQS